MKLDSGTDKDDSSKANSRESYEYYKKKSAERLKKFREENFPPNNLPFEDFDEEFEDESEFEFESEFEEENFPQIPPPHFIPNMPIPPHQFGAAHPFPPPLPPHLMPPLPPEFDGEFDEEFEEDGIFQPFERPPFGAPPFTSAPFEINSEFPEFEDERRGENLIRNAEVQRMQHEGGIRADEMHENEQIKGRLSKGLSFLISASVLGVLGIICAFFIMHIYEKNIKKGSETESIIASAESEDLRSRNYWFLSESPAHRVMKNFYMAMGDLEFVGNFEDISFRGFVSFKDKKESIYCIKRPDGTYIKLSMGAGARAYLSEIRESGEVATFKLLDGNINGKREEIVGIEAEKIRALTAYDDDPLTKAFPRNKIMRGDSGFSLGEKEVFYGMQCEVLHYQELNGLKKKYYFSENHTDLLALIIEIDGNKIECIFSNFIASDGGYRVPEKRKIFLNGELYAEVTADFIIRNRGALFPR